MTDKLPNPDAAVVEASKVRDYLLSPIHAIGRHKAQFFIALGYDPTNWQRLQSDLKLQAHGLVQSVLITDFGKKFDIRSVLTGPNGKSARLVSIWLLPPGYTHVRLITAYPEV